MSVDAAGKRRMSLDDRAKAGEIDLINVIDEKHNMRIARGNGDAASFFALDSDSKNVSGFRRRCARRIESRAGRVEDRLTHVHRHLLDLAGTQLELKRQHASTRFHAHR